MEGTILKLPGTEPGILRCNASVRYQFTLAEWKSPGLPRIGDRIDFELVDDQPREIFRLAAARPEPTVVSATSTLAIISLVAGILGLFWFGSLIAIVCGHIARASIRSSKGAIDGNGIALAGLIFGYVGLVLWLGVFLLIGSLSLWGLSLQP